MEQIKYIILPLVVGYLLDLILGDPRNLPHPIVAFGNSIDFFTKRLNKGKHRLVKGMLMTLFLTSAVFLLFWGISVWFFRINSIAYIVFTSLFVFYGLANRSLLQEGQAVFYELNNNGIEAGRKRLSWIVGRDTSELSAKEIRLAVFETLSENLSDGVVAPLFYYAIGGVPAMMCYKMINTLDSMIGYKNEKYLYFGRFAARLDDVANFIPARITAFLMALVTFNYRSLRFIFKYGKAHTSPNAGYPEAALAGILNCRFGGAHHYGGKLVAKPYIGNNDRDIADNEIKKIAYVNHAVCVVSVLLITVSQLIIYTL